MRSYPVIFITLIMLWLTACMVEEQQEDFILLSQVSKINLSTKQSLFFTADSVAKLELKVEYLDRQGKAIEYLGKFRPELLIDEEKALSAEIPLKQTKNYTIRYQLNDVLQSNEISIAVLPLAEAIKKI